MWRSRAFLVTVVTLLAAAPVVACMWDYDTLRDEKRGLPGVAEVLAGQWERHSPFFYRHRVEAMRAKLAAHPDDWDAIDNLAVALEKLDERDAAIAVLLDKERRHPGRYTTAANLGTVYIHRGDLPTGIIWLHRALSINPDAHFGREEYQVRLAEFLVRAKGNPKVRDDDFLDLRKYQFRQYADRQSARSRPTSGATSAPTTDLIDDDDGSLTDFWVYTQHSDDLTGYGLKPNVVDGLVGMVRFGTGTSPDLYFALGDVLAARGDKNLAFRAYQRALDFGYPRPDAVRAARNKVAEMEVSQDGLAPAVIAAERAAADKWVAEYQQFEDDLIRAGKETDDEASYAPFYATHARTLTTPDAFWSDTTALRAGSVFAGRPVLLLATFTALTTVALLTLTLLRRVARRLRFGRRPAPAIVPATSD